MKDTQKDADLIYEKYRKEFEEIEEINRRLQDGEKVDVPDLPADVRKAYSRYRFIISNLMADEVEKMDLDDFLRRSKNNR